MLSAVSIGPVVATLLGLTGCMTLARPRADAIPVTSLPIALAAGSSAGDRIGGLRYLGGLHLRSPDRLFGGLSSLRWNDGRLYTLSDQDGAWFEMTTIESHDRLIGIGPVRGTRLRGLDGAPLVGKRAGDAESMNLLTAPCGAARCRVTGVSIGFERDDRILTYRLRDGLPTGRPSRLGGIDHWLRRQPDNLGVEAMAGDATTTLVVSEGLSMLSSEASALLFRPGLNRGSRPTRQPVEIGVPASGAERPSDLAYLDGRRFILLRRSWSKAAGFVVEVERLTLTDTPAGPRVATTSLARLAPPLTTDNYEGAAIRREGGRTFLYLVSDDNFETDQRTLLLKFEIVG